MNSIANSRPAAHDVGTGPTRPAGFSRRVKMYCNPCGLEYTIPARVANSNGAGVLCVCDECGRPLTFTREGAK